MVIIQHALEDRFIPINTVGGSETDNVSVGGENVNNYTLVIKRGKLMICFIRGTNTHDFISEDGFYFPLILWIISCQIGLNSGHSFFTRAMATFSAKDDIPYNLWSSS